MEYCVVENGIIQSIIVIEEKDLGYFDVVPSYPNAKIGDRYSPPPSDHERISLLEKENAQLKAQVQAATDRTEFLEDCIAEMAGQVYKEV